MKNALLGLAVLLASTTFALSGAVDDQVDKIFEQYSKIHSSLAQDTTDGVDEAARSIEQIASQLKAAEPSASQLCSDLEKAAQRIQGKDLKEARLEFFELSKPLLVFLNRSYSGKKQYYRYYCDMAKKGWVQSETGTKNPYYGSSMLTCGELIK